MSTTWFSDRSLKKTSGLIALVIGLCTLVGFVVQVFASANTAAVTRSQYLTAREADSKYAVREDVKNVATREYVDQKFAVMDAKLEGIDKAIDRNSKILDGINAKIQTHPH